ncbi:MAG: class I SAM-dependent rRNA methyltransferase [Candidatus Sulfobium sp.]
MEELQRIHVKRTKRLFAGHLWIFSNELLESPGGYAAGSLVGVYDMKDHFLGTGYINPKSLIAVRLLTREDVEVNRDFFMKRITAALEMRERLSAANDSGRLVFSEGDYLPGLVADRYGNCLVLQFLTAGMEGFKDEIISIFEEVLNVEVIIIRNDSRSRTLEGLPLYKEIAKGLPVPLPVMSEDGILFEVDAYEGQKTGFFLDQRENRSAFAHLIKGGKGLDLFCYTGGWSLRLAAAGAVVTGVDESERAVRQAGRNAELNGLWDRASFVREDVFSFLRDELAEGAGRYDFIVLDPPAFVKSSSKVKEAVKAYRRLNELCMRLLRPAGLLATSSCSYHLGREMFLDMLRAAGKEAERSLRMIALRSQGADHPVLLSMPETEYLKCAFLVVDR